MSGVSLRRDFLRFVFSWGKTLIDVYGGFLPGVLVQDIDHFCPWTGTTIAKKNLRSFYVFVIGLFVQIVILVVSVVYALRHSGPLGHPHHRIAGT